MDDQLLVAGSALLERVREQVDSGEGLARIRDRRRRSRTALVAAAAAALLVGFVGVAALLRQTDAPVASDRPAELPVTVYFAALDGFDADVTGQCLAVEIGVEVGTTFTLRDRAGSALAAGIVTKPGEVVSHPRTAALGLPTDGDACLFELVTLTRSAATLRQAVIELGGRAWALPGSAEAGLTEAGLTEVGRQFVFYVKGSQP